MPYVIDSHDRLRRLTTHEWDEWNKLGRARARPRLDDLGTVGPDLPGGSPTLVLQWAHRYARDRGDRLVGGAPPWGKLLADEADARSIERGPDGFARRTP